MNLNPKNTEGDIHKYVCDNDGAEYLAAILPELVQIARSSGNEELGSQIDLAGQMAQKMTHKHAV